MANNTSILKEMAYGNAWFAGAHLAAKAQGQSVAESYLLGVRLRERAFGRRVVLKTISAEEFALAAKTATAEPENTPEIVAVTEPEIVAEMEPATEAVTESDNVAETVDTTLSLIDDFIGSGDHHRIVIGEQTGEESMAHFGGEDDDDEEFVSEELAEIYAKQGLFDEAIAIYRKLSLQNSQKSIYFAELIGQLSERTTQEGDKNDK
jgi:tetratricopeptide (TPR) repeat protein